MDTLELRGGWRPGHTEYCSNEKLMGGLDAHHVRAFNDAWDIDFIWHTNDGPAPWLERGRCTDMGHAEFLEGGTDRRTAKPCPFTSPEEVLAFDAEAEYGAPDHDELAAYYEKVYRDGQETYPDQVFTAGYYKTLVSGAIEAFGWDMLLMAAADQGRFEAVLDSFFRLSMHYYRAWAETSAPVFICHDDMVWTEGPFMAPDFYRRVIFPRYAALWEVLRDAGKKVLYCSDGNYTMFIDDIAEAGAHGFIFEPLTSLDEITARYGKTHVIIGSKVDCRTLTFGSEDAIRREIDATLETMADCPGSFVAVGNHIPSNVPVENALFYMEYLRRHWRRG
jgi:hypothetical protein